MPKKPVKKKLKVNRSAKSGKFISKRAAAASPETSVTETMPLPKKKKKTVKKKC